MDLFQTLANTAGKPEGLDARLARTVLDDVDFAMRASIAELAERAGVSAPSVTRFSRRIGCAGYPDFKVKLAQMAYVGLRYLKPEVTSTTPAEVAEDIVTKAQDALFRFHRQVDLTAMERAAQLLRGAEFIQAVGAGGNSSMIAGELHNRLFRLGLRVHSSNDLTMSLMQASAATEGTVTIVSSMTGIDVTLVRCVELLGQQGLPTIALTQSGSPLAKAASVVITIDLPEGQNIFRPSSTRFAYLAAVDVLANLVAYADRATSLQTLRRVKAELVRSRDGDDRQLLGD
ncbi:MurR/RpiR family transcriptional regulator [Paenirhodobacter populi]|uniref:MurR/RpiR family transcriptional regulator n=1 Tax=Paenirhodobacter populi TaxID=2306993 RepID=A0A443IN98_9RHOB|nr:MurR/RpiR family transcriptional regulator [Sinirhodobacter populi]RWR07444.1 MurR/RpiR family transcriptional regulator [Sinirhodobacter populi]